MIRCPKWIFQYLILVRYSQCLWKHKKNTIVPYVYDEAKEYYAKIKTQQEQIANSLQRQLNKPIITIDIKSSEINNKKRQAKKNKKIIDLQGIE